MTNIVAIIPARGGSKGVPNKNIIDFCDKPLIAWTIEQCLFSKNISDVWVSSDSEEILEVATKYGAKTIKRPDSISGDFASSESAWIHAIKAIEKSSKIDLVFAPQATSPLRETKDIDNAIKMFQKEKADSLLSVCPIRDFFMWKKSKGNKPKSVNYDYKDRKLRQQIDKKYLENGSFYIFKPHRLKLSSNRLSGKLVLYEMPIYKMFQIDDVEDLELCIHIMKAYNLNNKI